MRIDSIRGVSAIDSLTASSRRRAKTAFSLDPKPTEEDAASDKVPAMNDTDAGQDYPDEESEAAGNAIDLEA